MKRIGILVALALCLAGVRPTVSKAYTEELVTNSGIEYPISLQTGQDKNGKKVFEDETFFQYIKQETFASGSYSGNLFDLDEDGYLSKEECETVRVLSIAGRDDISSVAGIEAFPKLRELYCNQSGVTRLNLSYNPRLQILVCSNSKVKKLDIHACTILKELKISGCAITQLDLGTNSSIELLACQEQKRKAGGYWQNGQYCVNLNELDKDMRLSLISDVQIDGAEGDGIHSGYDATTGIVYCSDEIKTVSYVYHYNFTGTKNESIDSELKVTLTIEEGYRDNDIEPDDSKVPTNTVLNSMKEEAPANARYHLKLEYVLSDTLRKKLEGIPSLQDQTFAWGDSDIINKFEHPELCGYSITGWYTAKTGGVRITEGHTYGDIYRSQYPAYDTAKVPVLYARFAKTKYTIYYDVKGGSKVPNRENVVWGSANLFPAQKTKKAGYKFLGWRYHDKMVTKKTKIHKEDGYTDTIVLDAVWTKVSEKKGKTFKRYGCVYQVIKSGKKNTVRLLRLTKKKVTIRSKVFYNGKNYKLTRIQKKAFKKARQIRLKVSKKQMKKYTKMLRKAGAKKKAIKKVVMK